MKVQGILVPKLKLGPFRKVLEMGQICKVYIKTSRTKLHDIFIKNG